MFSNQRNMAGIPDMLFFVHCVTTRACTFRMFNILQIQNRGAEYQIPTQTK